MDYQAIREKLQAIEGTCLMVLGKDAVSRLTGEFELPKTYVNFLTEVGHGRIGNGQFQFYDGVVFVDEIFGCDTPETETVLLFGDDYQGSVVGFDRDSGRVVRVLSDQSISTIADSFEAFLAQEF